MTGRRQYCLGTSTHSAVRVATAATTLIFCFRNPNMPTSQKDQIPHIISVVQQVRPASVLDLGLGFGKYGFLLREYLDVATSMGLLPPPETTEGANGGPKVCIDGVEGCSTYVGELQHEVYDRIIEMNILDACKTL